MLGVIENQDGSIKLLTPAAGITVQEALEHIGEIGYVVPRSNIPTNNIFFNAYRMDVPNNLVHIDLAVAKDIVIGENERAAKMQITAIRPLWEEAVDNDDTVLMNQIKIDRKDIRDALADKIININAATTVAEVEAYLP